AVIAIVDEQGAPRSEAVYLTDPERYEAFRAHESATDDDVRSLLGSAANRGGVVPVEKALRGELAFGHVHFAQSSKLPRMVLALRVPSTEANAPARVLVADLSLGLLGRRIAALSSEGAEALLLDAEGRIVANALGAQRGLRPAARPRGNQRAV